MVVWGVFAVLTAAVAYAVMRPYWLQRVAGDARPLDVEVYKQQLREIDSELARGIIGEKEAEAARIEISRRLLAASSGSASQNAGQAGVSTLRGQQTLTAFLVAVMAILSIGLYSVFGSPWLPSQTQATRPPSQETRIAAMIERVEARLREHPEEGTGWEAIAPVYIRMGRFDDAVTAYNNAIKALGENGDRLANLGEALTFANNGVVSPEARTMLQKATEREPAHAKAGFWLGVADEQQGKLAEAIGRYKKLLDSDLPEDSKIFMRERVDKLSARLGGAPANEQPQQQPQQEQQTAQGPAASSADQAMIDGMVARLAERLKQDGSDLEGWMKLIKSYTVLGRRDDALAAVKDARAKFDGNAEALGQIDALARSLGLAS